jgi:hypothetical protein
LTWPNYPQLYRIAPLGEKPPDALATVFGNSRFACFVYAGDVLVGAASRGQPGGRRERFHLHPHLGVMRRGWAGP